MHWEVDWWCWDMVGSSERLLLKEGEYCGQSVGGGNGG